MEFYVRFSWASFYGRYSEGGRHGSEPVNFSSIVQVANPSAGCSPGVYSDGFPR